MINTILQTFVDLLNTQLSPAVPIRLAKRRYDKTIEINGEVYAGIDDSDSFSGYLLFPDTITRSESNNPESSCGGTYDVKAECKLIIYCFNVDIYKLEQRLIEIITDWGTNETTGYIVPKQSDFNSDAIWQRENNVDTSPNIDFKIIEILCEFNYTDVYNSRCITDFIC